MSIPDSPDAHEGAPMKQYLLSMYQPEGGMPDPAALSHIMEEVQAIRRQLQESGQWVFAGGLHPASTATVVRFDHGAPSVTDGPFAETKEHIGGITVIKAPDLDAALEWARRYAKATTLAIEVRLFRDAAG
jgi:hypothetical protein